MYYFTILTFSAKNLINNDTINNRKKKEKRKKTLYDATMKCIIKEKVQVSKKYIQYFSKKKKKNNVKMARSNVQLWFLHSFDNNNN